MNTWRRFGIGAWVMLTAVALSASAASGATAVGTSSEAGPEGRTAAIKAGLTKICEDAAADFLGRQRKTPEYAAVLDRVLTDPGRYITNLEANASYFENTGEVTATQPASHWRAEIRGDVSTEKFARVWKQTYLRAASPRLMVTVTEKSEGEEAELSVVGARIARYLLRQGFRMVDKEQFDEVKKKRLKEAALSDDLASVAAIARDVGADLLVVGDVTAVKSLDLDIEDVKFLRFTARASVKVVQADSAALVATERDSATGTSQDSAKAANDALEKCADKIARKVWKACLDNWDKLVPSTIRCELRVENVAAKDALTLEKKLAAVEGISSVTFIGLEAGNARFTIATGQSAKKLFAALIGSASVSGLIEVTGIANKVIRARWKEDDF